MKACSNPECESKGELLPLNRFHKRKQAKDGRTKRCTKCINKQNKPIRKSKEQIKREIELAEKIYCDKLRRTIKKGDCVPMCNPEKCIPCPNKQINNVGASSDTLTVEEERTMRHMGVYRSSSAYAVEDGYIDRDI